MPDMYKAQTPEDTTSHCPQEGYLPMAGNKPVSRYAKSEATGEGTLRGKVGRKRPSEKQTKGIKGATPPPSKGKFWERPLKA